MAESKYVSGRDGTSRGSYTLVTDAGAEIKQLTKQKPMPSPIPRILSWRVLKRMRLLALEQPRSFLCQLLLGL